MVDLGDNGRANRNTATPNYNGADTLGLGGNGAANRPDLVAPVSYPHTRLAWFNTRLFWSATRPMGWWHRSRLRQCWKGKIGLRRAV